MLLLAAGLGTARPADVRWGAPDHDAFAWLANAPQLTYIKTDVELRRSSYTPANGPAAEWDDLVLMPALGIQWGNYIYNPYLLKYTFLFEPQYYWQRIDGNAHPAVTREWMLNGTATVNLLAAKPYAVAMTYGRSHADVQADFFNSQTLDRENWSLLSGYRAGAVPVTVELEHLQDDRTTSSQEYITDQFKIWLHAAHDRKDGDMTMLDYQFNRFDNESTNAGGTYTSESRAHRALVTDRERFARSTLYSSLNVNRRESAGFASTDVNAFGNYVLTVTPSLDNFVNYSLSHNSANTTSALTNTVVAGLNHRLYESLGSHWEVHGTAADNDSGAASLRSTNGGASGTENYTKRLGDWGHLTINLSATYDVTDQQSNGGTLVIADESYAIPAVGPMIVRLKIPLVVMVTSVVKNNAPLDPDEWTIIKTSDPWQIQFFPGGAHSVASGDTILITYAVQSNPSGRYATRSYLAEIGLRFWHDQAGVRASYTRTANSVDAPGFVLQDLRQYQLGADVGWDGLHADATYTHQQSTFYSYKSFALSETYTRPLSRWTTVGVNCYQQWIDYPPAAGATPGRDQKLDFYSYMLRYDWRPTGTFDFSAEAGWQRQRGDAQDQDLFAARLYLNWTVGKLEAHLGFERENRQYVRDKFTRNYGFMRLRRNF
ncbi:MAG TPA: hypothetical protein VHE13_06990 [Opitutus sp.]|nr:hypothetical protein [Opitutus sp.]